MRTQLYHELLIHHLEERDWTEEDRLHFLRMVGRSTLLSAQSALAVLEFQQATDERIQAEKDYDEVFCQPTLFDHPPIIEATDISQEFFNQHWK